MERRILGNTDLEVSVLCLGTMTWGEQNSLKEAHEQLDRSVAAGINFIDAAEMYPVPPRAETQGSTEIYLGEWLRRQSRDQLVIATKVAGPGDWLSHIRKGPRLTREHIEQAMNDSLKRLQTDYIDLYQVHWPERRTNFFGKLAYQADDREDESVAIETTLEALDGLVRSGKVRHIGLSNETAWGAMHYLELAGRHGYSRMVSIQNPYNLLNRSFEVGLAEVSHREKLGLLAYSPLAFGVLTGKYLGGKRPDGARLTLYDRFSRYTSETAEAATQVYADVAQAFGISLTQLALAFVTSRPFVTSNIIGATQMAQLEENLDSVSMELSAELLEALEKVHHRYTYPCP